jgi:acyl-coenzyme A thioesterase PaaI-like protein
VEAQKEKEMAGEAAEAGPGNGPSRSRQQLLPDHVVDHLDDSSISGRVTFHEFYHGSRGAVHGGAVALMFDNVLGLVSLKGGRDRTRTAYLKVDYRSLAPIDEELSFAGWIEHHEGRKLFMAGELRRFSTVIAEGHALYVTLHPWQEATRD